MTRAEMRQVWGARIEEYRASGLSAKLGVQHMMLSPRDYGTGSKRLRVRPTL